MIASTAMTLMLRLRSFMALSARAILNAMARGRRQGQRMDAVTGIQPGSGGGVGHPRVAVWLSLHRAIHQTVAVSSWLAVHELRMIATSHLWTAVGHAADNRCAAASQRVFKRQHQWTNFANLPPMHGVGI